MDENTNNQASPPPTKAPADVYPTANKGALKDDPLVDVQPKTHSLKFWRASDDSFRGVYVLAAVVMVFGVVCAALFYRRFTGSSDDTARSSASKIFRALADKNPAVDKTQLEASFNNSLKSCGVPPTLSIVHTWSGSGDLRAEYSKIDYGARQDVAAATNTVIEKIKSADINVPDIICPTGDTGPLTSQ